MSLPLPQELSPSRIFPTAAAVMFSHTPPQELSFSGNFPHCRSSDVLPHSPAGAQSSVSLEISPTAVAVMFSPQELSFSGNFPHCRSSDVLPRLPQEPSFYGNFPHCRSSDVLPCRGSVSLEISPTATAVMFSHAPAGAQFKKTKQPMTQDTLLMQ
ncbi:unnamed protein product [Leuciscus chuanchicus]